MALPPLSHLLDGLKVVSLPLNTRFRGVQHREIAYIEGPCGVGEFAPFLEYEPDEASRWLAAAVEAAYVGWPEPVRDVVERSLVPVGGNLTVAQIDDARALDPERLERYRASAEREAWWRERVAASYEVLAAH